MTRLLLKFILQKLNRQVVPVEVARVHRLSASNLKTYVFAPAAAPTETPSALRQWPVQMHLINPAASSFQGTDLLLAADCVAFSLGNFHSKHLAGKSLVIACPKLDQGKEIYVEKIRRLIDEARVNTITVMMMEVPCCGGLSQLVKMAAAQATRKVPVKEIIVSIKGEILDEAWV